MVIGTIVAWIVTGLLVGFGVSKFLDLHGDDPRLGFGVAAGGAVVGGALYTLLSEAATMATWNWWGIVFAALGALAAVAAWHVVRSRSVDKSSYTRRSSYSSTGR